MTERRLSRWSKFDEQKYVTKFNFKKTFRDNFFLQCMDNTFVKY